MSEADKMFEELGYWKEEGTLKVMYTKKDHKDEYIAFFKGSKEFVKADAVLFEYISMEELKAINKKCEELGWL